MRRGPLYIFLLYTLIFAGLASANGAVLALAIPFAIYTLLGMWFTPKQVHILVERFLSTERTQPGTDVTMTLTINNQGGRVEEVYFQDLIHPGLTIIHGSAQKRCSMAPGQTRKWTYTFTGERGNFIFPGLKQTTSDHFGLSQITKQIDTDGQLLILPSFRRIKNVSIRPRQTRVYAGPIPARLGGTGISFFGLREYQPGDAPHWINWRASARHPQALFSNQFEQERVADVGIILDGRERTNITQGNHSLFEHTVIATAALADTFITAGHRVGLLKYGHTLRWTYPGYGQIQRERILQALARAEVGSSTVFSDLARMPSKLFPINSQLVLVSPLSNNDITTLVHWRARGYQVLVISPDPISYELQSLPDIPSIRLAMRIIRMERRVLLLRLQLSGVQVLYWNVSLPLDQVIKSRLGRPPAWHAAAGSRR
jgi:uncharacterized protein (DUF58 family)